MKYQSLNQINNINSLSIPFYNLEYLSKLLEPHLNIGGHLKNSYYILKSAATQEKILILSLDAGEIIYISEEEKNIDWENTLNSYIMGIN